MADQQAPASQESSGRSLPVRVMPFVVIAILVVVAIAVVSRPTPGSRTTTDTSVRVVIGMGEPVDQARYPVALQEGGDAAHEADHIFEPLQGAQGVSAATLDWSNGIVLSVEFDPGEISSAEVANLIAQTGYLQPPQ